MKVNNIKLTNFQNFDEESVNFPTGVTLIRGENGAGKSTLLRGVFAGLFISEMKKHSTDIDSIDKLVKKGEEEASVELEFEVRGDTYNVFWEIDADMNDDGSRSASTRTCKLTSTAFDEDEVIDGVTDVVEQIERLIGMDAESFVNSVYVQQDDLTRLAAASASERAEILDSLLGLSDIQEYIDRMKKARPAAHTVREDASSRQSEVEESLEKMKSVADLKSEKREITSEIRTKETEIEELEQKIDEWSEKQELVEEKIQTYEETHNRVEKLNQEINQKESKKQSLRQEIKEHSNELDNREDRIEQLEQKVQVKAEELEVDVTDANDAKESLDQLRETVTELSERKASVEADVEQAEQELDRLNGTVSEKQDELESISSQIEEARGSVSEKQSEIETIEATLDSKVSELIGTVKQYVETDEGFESSELDDSLPIKEMVKDKIVVLTEGQVSDRDRTEIKKGLYDLLSSYDEVESLDYEKQVCEANVEGLESRVERLVEQKNAVEADVDELSQDIDEQKDTVKRNREKRDSVEAELDNKQTVKSEVGDVVDRHMSIDEVESSLDETRSKIGEKNKRVQDLGEHLEQLTEQLEEAESEAVDAEIDELKKRESKIDNIIESNTKEVESIEQEVSKLSDTRAKIDEKIQTRNSLEERVEQLEQKRQWADDLYGEFNHTIDAYQSAKSKLRKQNIAQLNKYVNELFDEIYQNRSFDGVRIHEDYTIELVRTDGETIEPELSSGGEGAILNIALRAGVYKLITERVDTGGDFLPPFILDEPTTFLDQDHVNEIDGVMKKMRDWDVEQVLIVSHEEGLIDSADNEIRAIKDASGHSKAITNPEK
jgi:exonuclease SbcC